MNNSGFDSQGSIVQRGVVKHLFVDLTVEQQQVQTVVNKINSAMKKVTQKQKLSGLFPKGIVSTSSQTCMNAFSKAKDKSILAFDLRKRNFFPKKTWAWSILEF